MEDRLNQLDYYTLLGVQKDSVEADIRAAFRRFARKYHPDRYPAQDAKREQATAIYRRGAEGLQVLLDPAARKLYDYALEKGITRLTADQRDRAGKPKAKPVKPRQDVVNSPEARAYFEQGRTAMQQGELRKAWKFLRHALSIEPTSKLIEAEYRKVDRLLRQGFG